MKETLASLFKPIAVFCYDTINAIPLGVVPVIYIAMMAAMAIWVLTLKEENPKKFAAGSDKGPVALFFADLRFWAVLLLILQSMIIIIFK